MLYLLNNSLKQLIWGRKYFRHNPMSSHLRSNILCVVKCENESRFAKFTGMSPVPLGFYVGEIRPEISNSRIYICAFLDGTQWKTSELGWTEPDCSHPRVIYLKVFGQQKKKESHISYAQQEKCSQTANTIPAIKRGLLQYCHAANLSSKDKKSKSLDVPDN